MSGTPKISKAGQPYTEWEQVRTPVELKPVSKPVEPIMTSSTENVRGHAEVKGPMVPKHLYDDAMSDLKRAKASIGGLQDQIATLSLELNSVKARLAGLDRKRQGPTVWGEVTDDGMGLPS